MLRRGYPVCKHVAYAQGTVSMLLLSVFRCLVRLLCFLQINGEFYQMDRVGVGADRCLRVITLS